MCNFKTFFRLAGVMGSALFTDFNARCFSVLYLNANLAKSFNGLSCDVEEKLIFLIFLFVCTIQCTFSFRFSSSLGFSLSANAYAKPHPISDGLPVGAHGDFLFFYA